MMGGELKVESKRDQGSTFYFIARFNRCGKDGLPIMPAEGALTALPEVKRAKVLLVEDREVNRVLAARLLEKRGHQVVPAENGKEAVAILEQAVFDVVLMDVQMPVMDGYEATRIIRDPHSPVLRHDVPIIALTAHAMISDKQRCMAAGMNGYLPKPIKPDELAAAVEQYTGALGAATGSPAKKTAFFEDSRAFAVKPRREAGGGEMDFSTKTGPLAIIREELLKQYSGDEQLANELIGIFREELPKLVRGIKDAIEAGDAALIATQAHTCKSATSVVGLKEAANIIAMIEESAKRGELENALPHYERLESELKFFLL
jgi:CheY-like chemotaxis protein/HPt (histidine-containing phosphotransfer) domain-containing protein